MPIRTIVLCLLSWSLLSGSASSQLLEFERPPIDYHNCKADNQISRLQEQLDTGDLKLEFDEGTGYLTSVLKSLDISAESQLLVFSKTSVQLRKISPSRPRAVYFNDDTYIGFVQFGEVLEISTADSVLGGVFYTLRQEAREKPQFVRDRGQCLTCHASSRTKGVPGHLVRSVFSSRSGQPAYGSGTYLSDHASDFARRFGGWYITGTHGDVRHMGNEQVASTDYRAPLDRERGANVTDLSSRFDTKPYLRPTSDLVAMLVLDHQTQMHNYIALANMETRSALHYNAVMAKALERPKDELMDSARRRIESVANKLVEYLLFVDEFPYASPMKGVSGFADGFSSRKPHDSRARSLFQLDLKKRLLRYPCSWLIYSEAFEKLPKEAYRRVAERLHVVLTDAKTPAGFSHLSQQDRQAIFEILHDTMPRMAAIWNQSK
ncbi:MAG: hypothetical protein QGG09_21500 [Pirellulaceae bacterium]|jgi:hypothetical protein|nr:hypothetical protein [Pirellulaceae bacterium]HJN10485.1 hypothetical protein [Pirellulaceae bacterium]